MALSLLDPTLASLLGGNDFFPDFSSDTGRTERQNVRGIPLDLIETPSEFIIKADVPGVKKDQIKVSVNEDVLTISVEPNEEDKKQQAQQQQQQQGQQQQQQGDQKKGEKKDDQIVVHRKERVQRFARRRIRMPVSADLKNIKAHYQDGVLELHIPKDEEKVKQRTIPVE